MKAAKNSRNNGLWLVVLWLMAMPVWGQPQNTMESDGSVEAGKADGKSDRLAVVISIPGSLSEPGVEIVKKDMKQAVEAGAGTIIFKFDGHGQTYTLFSQLAREIVRVSNRENVKTIAFIPDSARGTTLLGVFACNVIAADSFAQIGQMLVPVQPGEYGMPDDKILANRLVSFADENGHDPMLAEAMTRQKIILYRIEKQGRQKFVDQAGFQNLVQNDGTWKMVGGGPLVNADETLLISGRQAKELGLVKALAVDEIELASTLNLRIADLDSLISRKTRPGQPKTTVIDPCQPAQADAGKLAADDPCAAGQDKAVFIACSEMVDEGLFESIKRRTEAALEDGATYIIYEMDTFGGRVDSAIAIYDYILNDVSLRAHTVAYVRTKAISAGALISVACKDIIMKANSQIGDSAPVAMGGTIEGVEREKIESPLRSYFEKAAEANGYPAAICKAMVTISIEVYEIRNLQTGDYEYFEGDNLPTDAYMYDLKNKKLICTSEQLVTLDADDAVDYGLSRGIVEGLDEQARNSVLAFFEERDGVSFSRPPNILTTNWSEEMVRWLTSPTVTGILFMLALLGIYVEMNTPGLGIPGAVAVIAFVVLVGSKYLIGMANWWEIAMFILGFLLLLLEVFIIPGIGIAGISGILLMIFGIVAMLLGNRPDELPIPRGDYEWKNLTDNLTAMGVGFLFFVAIAALITIYLPNILPRIPGANRFILLAPPVPPDDQPGGSPSPGTNYTDEDELVKIGQKGVTITSLRPAGQARFGNERVDVVSAGSMIDPNVEVKVIEIEGNRIVVKET